jgi:hypothetical protein
MQGLQGIPSHSLYRHNTNVVPNPQDSRVSSSLTVGGGKRRKRRTRRQRQQHRRTKTNARNTRNTRTRNRGGKRDKKKKYYVNYAGRQIGHQSRSQSGGMSLLPGDANLITSQVGHLLQNGVATLRGLDKGPDPLPFSDTVNMNNQNL